MAVLLFRPTQYIGLRTMLKRGKSCMLELKHGIGRRPDRPIPTHGGNNNAKTDTGNNADLFCAVSRASLGVDINLFLDQCILHNQQRSIQSLSSSQEVGI